MQIIWNQPAILARARRIKKAQNYVDRACLEKMTPYVPVALKKYKNSGRLRQSGKIHSPGRIVYTAPLARYAYYAKVHHEHGENPHGRRKWFQVMKTKYKHEIGAGAARIMGAKYK